jgi:acetyl-CoA carboxylase biotin carboxyl carrier protein
MTRALTKKDITKSEHDSPDNNHSSNPMDMTLLQQIVQLMTTNDLNTVDVRDGAKRVIIKRGAQLVATAAPLPVSPSPALPVSSSSSPGLPDAESSLIAIKSPMVGTFYSASSPDAKPLASIGMQVDDDTDVCIIEAMKVFNNIKAECKGTITKIMVNNGQTVEFGQTLFLVKP